MSIRAVGPPFRRETSVTAQSQPNNTPGMGQAQQDQTIDESSQSGLGDLVLEAGYVLMTESSSIARVRASSFIKLPTADEKKGLGTGEFDLGIGMQVSKWFDEWHGYAETTLVFQGARRCLASRILSVRKPASTICWRAGHLLHSLCGGRAHLQHIVRTARSTRQTQHALVGPQRIDRLSGRGTG